ncbi:hypothetical protein [Paraburkholderia sediminicola]|nr:hypothetical protein [Paraburkholderia sediminicola]
MEQQNGNPMKSLRESTLMAANAKLSIAKSRDDKASALQLKADALADLGKGIDAWPYMMQAAALRIQPTDIDFEIDESYIMFAAGMLREARDMADLALNHAEQKARQSRDAQIPDLIYGAAQMAAWTNVQMKDWRHAQNSLVTMASASESNTTQLEYTALLYVVVQAASDGSLPKDPSLEALLSRLDQVVVPRDVQNALLRYFRGFGTEAGIETAVEKCCDVVGRQNALAEAIFFLGAHEKFVNGVPVGGRPYLAKLNALAPYGVVEWSLAQGLLN